MSIWRRRSDIASSEKAPGVVRVKAGARALGVRAVRLAAIPNGTRVRMYGLARPADILLSSPVLERPCIAYRLVVEVPAWHKVLERAACAPFLAQDGDIAVSVRGPFEVVLRGAYDWEFGHAVQRRITLLLGDEWSPSDDSIDPVYGQDYRFFEALIQQGDRVSIEGFASVTVDPAGERSALREPPLLYTIAGTTERPAIVSIPDRGSVAP